MQADGRNLVGGQITTLGGQPRNCLGRLNNTSPATENLAYDGSVTTWLRGGTSPEVWRTTFEASTNGGADWFSLGDGTRISGGWELTGVSVATNSSIRTRGLTTGGKYNSSSWFVESSITLPPPTLAELIERLVKLVSESDQRIQRPVLATLEAALASIQCGNCRSATGQLHAFQNKVHAQIQLRAPARAMDLIHAAGQVIAALDSDHSTHTAIRIRSFKRHPNGRMQLQIEGMTGQACVIEASANLVDWETISTPTLQTDGSFEFEDPFAAGQTRRLYRVSQSVRPPQRPGTEHKVD